MAVFIVECRHSLFGFGGAVGFREGMGKGGLGGEGRGVLWNYYNISYIFTVFTYLQFYTMVDLSVAVL